MHNNHNTMNTMNTMNATTANATINEKRITTDFLDFIKTLNVHLWICGVGEREFSLKDGPYVTLGRIQKWIKKGRWFDPYDSGLDIVIFDNGGALYELSSGHTYSIASRLYDALKAVERKFNSDRKDVRFEPTFVLIGKKYRIADKAKDGTVLLSEPVSKIDDYEY